MMGSLLLRWHSVNAVLNRLGPQLGDDLWASNRRKYSGVNEVQRGSQFIIAFWHQLVLDLQLADYSRVNSDGVEDTIIDPENPGPCYASRAMAMVHLAMYDAFVGVTGDAATYLLYADADLPPAIPGAAL